MQAICKNCGNTFEHISNTRGKFCSVSCYHAFLRSDRSDYHKIEYVDLVCEHCGTSFKRRKHEANRRAHSFCSKECAGKATATQPLSRAPRKPSLEKHCVTCGKAFMTKGSQPDRKFCDKACEMAWRRKHFIGDGNPNFKYGHNQVSAKHIAFANYRAACAICGFDVRVEVHHIVQRAAGGRNDPDNLVILCPNHHVMAQYNLINPDELLQAARKAKL